MRVALHDSDYNGFPNYALMSRSTLDGFRRMLENMPSVLMRDSVTYKNAVRFGLVEPAPKKVVFYFEKMDAEVEG